jgi:transcriptional regulator with PAS, ATPase and Fis domain
MNVDPVEVSWDKLVTSHKTHWGESLEDLVLLRYGPEPQDVMLGSDAKIKTIFAMIQKIAVTNATVILRGEHGTGKEGFAKAIHLLSPRKAEPFVVVDCAAIPDSLWEGELYGHEKGAYTGAHERFVGSFRLANGGTLVLDGISDVPLHLQGKFLRTVEQKEVYGLHARRPEPIDIRIVATTNVSIEDMMARGDFRKDLYYRIGLFPVTLPPLRERQQDILPLARFFITLFSLQLNRERIKKISPKCEKAILQHEWTGNIRELKNRMEYVVTLAKGSTILPKDVFYQSPPLQSSSNSEHLELILLQAFAPDKPKNYATYILEFVNQNGRPPTSREIAKLLNVSVHQAQIYLKRIRNSMGLTN